MAVSDPASRKYGIVVLGASGYTGTMVCQHIGAKFSTNLKWSVAGRSRERLETLAAKLRKEYPDRVQPGEKIQQMGAIEEVHIDLLMRSDQILKLLSLMIHRRSARSLAGLRCASVVLSTQLMETPLYGLVLSSELTMWTGLFSHSLCISLPVDAGNY